MYVYSFIHLYTYVGMHLMILLLPTHCLFIAYSLPTYAVPQVGTVPGMLNIHIDNYWTAFWSPIRSR